MGIKMKQDWPRVNIVAARRWARDSRYTILSAFDVAFFYIKTPF